MLASSPVSAWSIAAMVFSGLLSLGLPLFFAIYFGVKHKISLKVVFVGLLVFIVFSQFLEKLLHLYVLSWNQQSAQLLKDNPFLYALYGGLAAGIFEEVGRWIAFVLVLKMHREWKDGVALGIGHGGVESLMLGVTLQVNNVIYSVLINLGLFDATLGAQLTPAMAAYVKSALADTPPLLFAMSGLERAMAFLLQVALSVLVLYGVKRKNLLWLFAAILIHAAVDFPAALYQSGVLSLWLVEGMLAVVAVLSVVFIVYSKRLFAPPVLHEAENTL